MEMIVKRESMVVYDSFVSATSKLPAEQYKRVWERVFKYAMEGVDIGSEDLTEDIVFTLIKPQIDANNRKYMNGKSGGRPAKSSPQLEIESEDNITSVNILNKKPMVSELKTYGFDDENLRFQNRKPNEKVNDNATENANVTVNGKEKGYGEKRTTGDTPNRAEQVRRLLEETRSKLYAN